MLPGVGRCKDSGCTRTVCREMEALTFNHEVLRRCIITEGQPWFVQTARAPNRRVILGGNLCLPLPTPKNLLLGVLSKLGSQKHKPPELAECSADCSIKSHDP